MSFVRGIIADSEEGDIEKWLDAFLLERRIRHVTQGSLRWYTQKLTPFVDWCQQEGLTSLLGLTPYHLRLFLLHLEETNHNPGGVHGHYRAVRSFLHFFEEEAEPESWANPIRKLGAPKVPSTRIAPVPLQEISKLVKVCAGQPSIGSRDKAVFLTLLDTGLRTMELAGIDMEDCVT